MRENLRRSGIDIIGNVSWGTHFCQFYQTKEDLADILVPYFKAGLENNEFCLWVTSQPLEVEDAKEALRKAVPDLDSCLHNGQIEIISYTSLHVTGSIYDSERVINYWIEKLNHALESGYEGLRLSGNTSWLEKKDWSYFVDYMGKFDDIICKYRMIALGSYFVGKYSTTEIIEIVSNHQFSLSKKEEKWERIDNIGRKKAEDAVFQATKNWEHTFDAVPDLISIIDGNYRIVRANKSMAARLGVTPEECIGLTCYRVVHGTDEPPSFCPHRQLLKDGIEHTKEVREDNLGGDFIVSVSPLHDSEGKLTGCIHVARDITDRKRVEEALRQSEQRVRLKLESILSPAREMTDLELADIVDVQAIQYLMDYFYKLTHIPIGLNDLKGNVLVSVGWQDICTKFHRVHPEACKHCVESDIKLSSGVSPGEFKLYKCKNNMWDIVTPIMVGDQHIGYIFAGQFFFEDEPLDYELFRSQARQYGFNEKEYITALEKVSRLSREAVDTGMAFLMTFANMFSQLSYSNVKLAQSLAERDVLVDALRQSEKRERARSDELAVILDAVPVAVYIAHDPQALQIIGNRLSYEWLRIPIGTNLSKSAPEGERTEKFRLFKDGVEIPPANMPSQMSAAGIEINGCELDIVSDGTVRHVLGNARPLRDEQGDIRGSVSAFIDITERKRAEEALKKAHESLEEKVKVRTSELEEAYQALMESEQSLAEAQRMAHLGNWEWNIVTNRLYWSDESSRIFGHDLQEFGVTYNSFLSYVHPDDRDSVDNAVKEALSGKPYDIDYRIISANGEERIVHAHGEVIFNEENIPVRMRGTVQDITERKKAEEALEKIQAAHIKEIHHRIKNNLQVISSLLSLEAERFSDAKMLESFRQSQDRVASMALIHEELYKGNELDTLDFAAYLQKLTADLFGSYNLSDNISLKLDLEQIYLGMDTAIPLGIIVNELVSNSLKHAFPAGKSGEIYINLCKKESFAANYDIPGPCPSCMEKNGFHYVLIVADNGKGIPEKIEFKNADSLGLQLVNILVEQVDGCMELKRNNGTEFTIWFNNIDK